NGVGRPATVLAWGEIHRGESSPQDFYRRVAHLNLRTPNVMVVLAPSEYQIQQVEAPNVPPAEMRAAARWLVRDIADVHIDDLTLDILRIGDDKARNPQLYAIISPNIAIKATLDRLDAAKLTPTIIDIQETAQRNLQSALAKASNREIRATAALTLSDTQALLTLCANDELFFTRRSDIDLNQLQEAIRQKDDDTYVSTPARFFTEIQRSLDLWERNYPDLPLDNMFVDTGPLGAALINSLQKNLSLPITPIQLNNLFPTINNQPLPEEISPYLPLFGCVLRQEPVKL
ncbi:MAG: hypothetical protein JNM52_01415, partial [Betaproteobacteria bacterium]|nr:hypothetical protein [Betaproteobacteria bacterium]